jgi:hypothetical protein
VLSFKAFLVEAKRTRPQAQKILNRITPSLGRGYNNGDISTIIPHEYYPAFRTPDGRAIGNNYDNQHTYAETKGRLKKVPVKSIVTDQSTINSGVLKKKIQGKWPEPHYPDIPTALHHNGVHYLLDGNHRVAKARLLGQSHILMRVADARPFENEDYKKEFKKKFPDPVDEAFEKKTYVPWKKASVSVFKNPDHEEMKQMGTSLRFIAHGHDMYAWPAHEAQHSDIYRGLNIPQDHSLYGIANHHRKTFEMYTPDDNLATDHAYLKSDHYKQHFANYKTNWNESVNEKWSTERYESPRTGKKIFARNQTTIDGHHVDVHFSGTGDKDFSVNYMVNGSYWRSPKMNKKTGQKIIGHVHRSIMSFARHMKPASLNFSSSKDRNIDLHAKLSARLARRHKGSVETRQVTDLTHHTVKFPMTESDENFNPTHEGWHGTPDARDIRKNGFKTLKLRHTGKDDDAVYWATKDYKTASTYADPHRAFDYQNSEPATLPVQLQMKNPKVINWGGRSFRGKDAQTGERYAIDDHIQQARTEGHDGFIIHKVKDTYDAKGKPTTIMGVFHHTNIRVKPK